MTSVTADDLAPEKGSTSKGWSFLLVDLENS